MSKIDLKTPIQFLKGVGPKLADKLKKLGVETVSDAIYFFPREYEDRSNPTAIGELQNDSGQVVIKGEISAIYHQQTRSRFSIMKVSIYDRTGSIQAVWFNQPFLDRLFRQGMRLIISGKVEYSEFDGVRQITVKDFEIDTGQNLSIVPRYPLTEGIYPKKMVGIVQASLDASLSEIEEWLPEELIKRYKLSDLQSSIKSLHHPAKMAKIGPARRRLAFDDFFLFQLGIALKKEGRKKEQGLSFKPDRTLIEQFIKTLPFELTTAQNKVVAEIFADMERAQPMNRLLQGDVGSGKTIVAAIAAINAINNGYQVALMAPTEILAQQHYAKLSKLLSNVKVALMTRVSKPKERADLYIGTHALIQSNVVYEKLGLVIIDEQHRFGVEQRSALAKKGKTPDVLVMTATPIPRSLSLTIYGELDKSVIDELPPGRTPIKTHFVPGSKRRSSYNFIREKIKEGRQVYVVCPLVEESEKSDLKAAKAEAIRLQEIFAEYQVGLIHGRMKSVEKERIMKKFAQNKIHILVSTTVIEVGIDVPNATVMLIEHVERFGLSQLHQLRGRIGRGEEQSFCFMIGEVKTDEAKERVKAMQESTDGFHIAEIDLKLRGPGDFFGTRQSGLPLFRVADIIRDERILNEARLAAFELIKKDEKYARNLWESQRDKIKSAGISVI
ncbi:MAG: ATP-dependent DNA helicase RecG [bacterium]